MQQPWILKIVPEVDSEGFGAPKKIAAKKAAVAKPQTPAGTRNRYSLLPRSSEEEQNKDISLDAPLSALQLETAVEPYPALENRTQEAKTKQGLTSGTKKKVTFSSSLHAPVASAVSIQESMCISNEHQYQNQSTTAKGRSRRRPARSSPGTRRRLT